MPTQNVNLSQQQVKFIRRSIERGRYQSVSEVVRAGLRLLEEQERQDKLKLEALRRLAQESFDEISAGLFETVNAEGLDAFMARAAANAAHKPR